VTDKIPTRQIDAEIERLQNEQALALCASIQNNCNQEDWQRAADLGALIQRLAIIREDGKLGYLRRILTLALTEQGRLPRIF